jgi:hypothetical protein
MAAAEPTGRPTRTSAATAGKQARATAPPPREQVFRAATRAAERVGSSETMLIELPDGLGTVRLPSAKRLAFYGGIVALAAFGIVDWPVALVIGAGHLLAEDHNHRTLAEFGEALAEA